MRLENKVALISGGARGMGAVEAKLFAKEGAKVVIGDMLEDEGRKIEAEVNEAGGECVFVVLDVSAEDAWKRAVTEAVSRYGKLDILINNAGVGGYTKIVDQSLEEWRSIIDTNLSGVFHCCRSAIPHLRRRGGGFIVNISSLAGKNAFPMGGAYCSSKAALNMFSEVLMQEVRYDDIRVSYVMPGSVTTAFDGGRAHAGSEWKMTAEDVAEVVLDIVSINRRTLASRVEMRPSKPKK